MSWTEIPNAMRLLDSRPKALVVEAVPAQIVWCCLHELPSLAPMMSLPHGLVWQRGGRGEGDLVGYLPGIPPARWMPRPAVHLELKSNKAADSWGSDCPHKCGVNKSQFAHMAEDASAQIAVITHASRHTKLVTIVQQAGVPHALHFNFSQLGDMIGAALLIDGVPKDSLIQSMLDV